MSSCAADYAARLLRDLGESARPAAPHSAHPALRWRDCGLMALTGRADGPGVMLPAPLASCADGVTLALHTLAPSVELPLGGTLLGERARLLGLRRAGASSPGGHCRLLPAADGVIALNLARDEDRELLPAWLEADIAPHWAAVSSAVASRSAAGLERRGAEMGLAVAMSRAPQGRPWLRRARHAAPLAPRRRRPRVVDLGALWAGPLCGRLLAALGAEVVKVESAGRPDGARRGSPAFFERLNGAKQCLSLDFATAAGRAELQRLIAGADIVIEASRPRALRQLGIDAEALIRARPGLSWISLSGYGRGGDDGQRVAFGDDAAVAAGLSHVLHQTTGEWLIGGDAIADPLTGLHAALAAWASWRQGGGELISLAMRDVVAHALSFDLPSSAAALQGRQRAWTALTEHRRAAA